MPKNINGEAAWYIATLRTVILAQGQTIEELKAQLRSYQIDLEWFRNDNIKTRYYTGIPEFSTLETLFNEVEPYIKWSNLFSLSKSQMLILTLMKLRLVLHFTDLEYRFGVSLITASRTFYAMIDVLYYRIGNLASRLNAWFLDDGTIGDEFNILLEDIDKVLEFCNESGLTLNSSKCEVFFINTSPEAQTEMMQKLNRLLPGIKVIDAASFQLLGAPILEESLAEMLSTGLDNVKTLCKRLTLLDIHPALRVLRCSLSSPRFQYLLRASPTFIRISQLNEIDEFYKRTLEAITNNKLSDTSWTQASLPLSASGLGIRKLTELAMPAYFSSAYQSEELSNRILNKTDIVCLNARFATFVLIIRVI